MQPETDRHDGVGRTAQLLRRIEEALGRPRETFEAGASAAAIAQADELMRLWSALDREPDWQRVLQFMRALAVDRADRWGALVKGDCRSLS